MKKSRRTYNGVHLNKKSNTQDVVEQSLTNYKSLIISVFIKTVVYYVKLEWILYNIIV